MGRRKKKNGVVEADGDDDDDPMAKYRQLYAQSPGGRPFRKECHLSESAVIELRDNSIDRLFINKFAAVFFFFLFQFFFFLTVLGLQKGWWVHDQCSFYSLVHW